MPIRGRGRSRSARDERIGDKLRRCPRLRDDLSGGRHDERAFAIVGTPFYTRVEMRTSPTPSSVITFSVSSSGFPERRSRGRTPFCSCGVARSAC